MTRVQLDDKVGVVVLTNTNDSNPGDVANQLLATVGDAVAKAAAPELPWNVARDRGIHGLDRQGAPTGPGAFDSDGFGRREARVLESMPVVIGIRLRPYELVGAIGAGGMGEVYRGRDGTLNRDVAIKVLPAAMAEDTESAAINSGPQGGLYARRRES